MNALLLKKKNEGQFRRKLSYDVSARYVLAGTLEKDKVVSKHNFLLDPYRFIKYISVLK